MLLGRQSTPWLKESRSAGGRWGAELTRVLRLREGRLYAKPLAEEWIQMGTCRENSTAAGEHARVQPASARREEQRREEKLMWSWRVLLEKNPTLAVVWQTLVKHWG